jgi:diguanylate cyclase (GGDEF)-like protein/PAS domain S-box-containing protein
MRGKDRGANAQSGASGSAEGASAASDTFSEQQLQALFDLMVDLACVATADGRYLHLNPAWERVLGYTREELKQKPILELLHPHDVQSSRVAIEQLSRGVPQVRFENRYRCRDGSYKWLEWNSVPDHETGLLYGFARDITDSKAQEERLTRRERQLVEAQALAGVGSWEWNLDTLQITWSEEAYALFGLTPHEIEIDYDYAIQIVHPDDRPLVEHALQTLLRESKSYAVEYRVIRSDGDVRTVSSRAKSVLDDSGSPSRLIGTLQDVTEQKRATRESRLLARTAHALNTTEDLSSALSITLEELCDTEGWDYGEFWFPRADGSQLDCHPATYARDPEQLREFRAETVRRSKLSEFSLPSRVWMRKRAEWHTDLRELPREVFSRGELASKASLRSSVGVPLMVDGTVAAVLVLMRHAPSLEDAHQLATLSTVAAQLGTLVRRREAEEALKRSEARFQIAARATSDVIYDYDLREQTLWLSEAITRNFGHRIVRPEYGFLTELIHPDDTARIRDGLAKAIASGATLWSDEYRFRRADGRYAMVFDRGYISRDDSGRAVRLSGSLLDISERAQHEAALHEAKESAEAAARAKSQFLANMSHEIRTPLTAVLGFADLMLDPKLSESDRLDYVMTVRRNGEHLLSILNDILDLSKVEAGKLSLEQIPCSPAQVLTDVASLMRVRAVEKGLAFDVVYGSPIPSMVRTDPTRLRQVVLNLVSNAIKFTERGGVSVTARCEHIDQQNPELVISVRDSGIGMDATQVARLFQPFSQADASMSRRYGGSGLGLGISGPLAAALGGAITVQSELSQGSTFTLRVPVEKVAGAELLEHPEEALVSSAPSSIPALHPTLRGEGRVLLAEDGRDNQVLLGTLLRKHGFEVEVVENGRRAVQRALDAVASGKPFDVVLMDMQMPELDGYGATAQLRGRSYTGPIVALTAHAMTGERERCLAAGCDDYLTKPVERAALIEAVKQHAHRAASSRPPPALISSRAPHGIAQRGGRERLVSVFAHDPDMAEIVAGFVRGLPVQVAALMAASARGDRPLLLRLAHQLKGAAGGYGFPTVSEAAGRLEAVARVEDAPLQEALNELVERCERTQLTGLPSLEPPAIEAATRRRILAIDDSPQIQELIAARLRSENVLLVSAMSATEGLALAYGDPPDLVLLDLDLPDASGLEVCRQLQGDPRTAAIPVLFLTGTADAQTKAAALDLGAIDYVTKPFDATELRARVRSALRTKHYQDLLATRAQVDGLTGLWNRAHFDSRLADEIAAATRHGRPLALAMLDLDHFKRINDTFGHPFGDQVLQEVAAALTRTVRTSDLVCRYGGEEFVAILRETGAEAALLSAERLRAAMAKLSLEAKGQHVPVTISLGVAALEPPYDSKHELGPVQLVGAADAALYEAKRAGRDRVVLGDLRG